MWWDGVDIVNSWDREERVLDGASAKDVVGVVASNETRFRGRSGVRFPAFKAVLSSIPFWILLTRPWCTSTVTLFGICLALSLDNKDNMDISCWVLRHQWNSLCKLVDFDLQIFCFFEREIYCDFESLFINRDAIWMQHFMGHQVNYTVCNLHSRAVQYNDIYYWWQWITHRWWSRMKYLITSENYVMWWRDRFGINILWYIKFPDSLVNSVFFCSLSFSLSNLQTRVP